MDQRPIGVFDSGLGGLTAVKALETILPGENLIYFGDSRNAPYGTRSLAEIRALAAANAAFLRGFDCKAVLVACGTVSSNAMDDLHRNFDLPFFDVLEAPCRRAAELTRTGRVAVIATEATVRSGAFVRTLKALAPEIQVYAKPCQSLVATAESGHFCAGDPAAEQAVAAELAPVRDWQPDVLLLACTHFPLFRDSIAAYLGPDTALLSVSDAAADAMRERLAAADGLAAREKGTARFFTSGDPATFAAQGAVFLGHAITAAQHINEVTL